MNRIIEKITGKNASPAKRYTAYAALITAAVLIIALCVLIVSSIVFAVSDDGTDSIPSGDNVGGDNDSLGGAVSSSVVQYETVTADKLKPTTVSVQEKRSKLSGLTDNDMYYGAYKNVKLTSEAQKSLDSMLVAFYNAKKAEKADLKTNTKSSDCNIPCIKADTSYDSFTFDIVIYTGEKTIYSTDKNSVYSWIYTNASSYGFIYGGTDSNKFTYVGVAIAKYMTNNKVTSLDKVADATSGKNVSVQAVAVGATKATVYEIYYLASNATELKVPTNYSYTVIANGTSGYFIVINKSEKISAVTNNSLG